MEAKHNEGYLDLFAEDRSFPKRTNGRKPTTWRRVDTPDNNNSFEGLTQGENIFEGLTLGTQSVANASDL